jgi:uncharacterized RDD family membrane protein YckC
MVDRRTWASWLSGPVAATRLEGDYPGRRLGLPETGSGSVGRFGRRCVALGLDWGMALVLTRGLLGGDHPVQLQWITLGVFAVTQGILVGTLGGSIGHLMLGLRVSRVDGHPAGPVRAFGRGVLLAMAVPPLVWDRDQRGLHDRLVGTVLTRA